MMRHSPGKHAAAVRRSWINGAIAGSLSARLDYPRLAAGGWRLAASARAHNSNTDGNGATCSRPGVWRGGP
ncbi:hypothetical protein ABB25_00285 [Stenotrophomonas koreensis]|uniref:Uncharacterized protein n=1 Tax=Stenotrophomonas koreensis TaxID=266128 RepID=A0A0R0BV09_9GAMM|nr:hypothetical protein ABB25_00285 [Stenotrophomonas koreensis]